MLLTFFEVSAQSGCYIAIGVGITQHSIVPRPNPFMRKASGDTNLNPLASVIISVGLQMDHGWFYNITLNNVIEVLVHTLLFQSRVHKNGRLQ